MRKKIQKIGLIAVTFLMTGCTVQYDLYFGDNVITENIIIKENKVDIDENNLSYLKEKNPNTLINDLDEFYEKKMNETEKDITGALTYNYTYSNFRHANLIKPCYEVIGFAEDETSYSLSTSNSFECLLYEYNPLDSVQINISTNHKVLENNADTVENGIYTWNVNEENVNNKEIYIKFSKDLDPEYINKEKQKEYFNYLIIIISTIIIISGIIVYMKLKNRKNNNI